MVGKRYLRTAWAPDLVASLFLLAMVLWFTSEIVWDGKVPFYRDLGPYFYPMRFNLAMSLQAGELPLWNRHVAMGFPLAANIQSGAFYPPHLLFLVLPFFDAVRFLYLFHFLVAATGCYALCRRWSYPPYLALIGSILFTFGGLIVSLTNLLDHFQTAVWLPWILFLGERSLGAFSSRNFSLLTLTMAVQLLAGSPEIYGMTQGLLVLDGLRLKTGGSGVTPRRLFLLLLGSNLCVAGLTMVQILPTLELYRHSWRSETIPYAKVTAWSLHPIRFINLFFLDKEVNPYAFNGLHLYFTQEFPLIVSLYLGALFIPGVSFWFLTSPPREKAVLLGLVVVSAVVVMGSYTPIYSFLFKALPLFRMVRFPEKFFFFTSTLLLFITLKGSSRLLNLDFSLSRLALLVLFLLPALILLLPYVFFRFKVDTLIQYVAWANGSSGADVTTLKVSSGVLVHLERQLLLTFGVTLLLFLWRVRRLHSALFKVLLVAVLFLDLTSAHRPYNFLLDPNFIYRGSHILPDPNSERYRLFYILHLKNLHPSAYAFTKKPYAETVSSVFATLIPNTGVFYGFDYMQELDALGRKPYNLFLKVANELPPERLFHLLGTFNVRFISSFRELPQGEVTLIRHFPEYPVWLYRVERVVPRTYIVQNAVVERDSLRALERLSSPEFEAMQEVILEHPVSLRANRDFQAQAQITRYGNQHVIIQAALASEGILVLADSFYPGWEVYVDGEKREILKANFFFRGVLLPPGEHLVEFKYQPRWFQIGLVLSSVSGILLLLVAAFDVFKRGRLRSGRPD